MMWKFWRSPILYLLILYVCIFFLTIINFFLIYFVNVVAAPVAKRSRKNRGSRGRPRARSNRPPTNLSATAPLDSTPIKTENSSDGADGARGPSRSSGRQRSVKNEPQRKSLDSSRSLRPRKRTLGETEAPTTPASHPPKHDPAASTWDGNDDAESAVEMILLPTDTSILKDESWGNAPTPSPPTPPPASPPPPPPPPPAPVDNKRIPRLIDVAPAHRREALVGVVPLDWTVQNVAHFLKTNDCTAYSSAFTEAVIWFELNRYKYFGLRIFYHWS